MTTDERIEKMERQLVRMRWFNRCLIVCIILALGGWCGWKTFGPQKTKQTWTMVREDTIRARKVIIEDEKGRNRILLSAKTDAAIVLVDEDQKICATLGSQEEGPSLGLYDENGNIRANLRLTKDGPLLGLIDENGKLRVQLGKGQTKAPDGKVISYPESSLNLFGADGKVIWAAP